MNPENSSPILPFDIQMTSFSYDETLNELSIDFIENAAFNEHVGQVLKLDRPATHAEAKMFFTETVAKSIAGDDGYEISKDEPEEEKSRIILP